MRVAIVHYHLRSGGVFRVVRNTLGAFEERDVHFGIIVGEAPGGDEFPDGSYICVPELCYDADAPACEPAELVDKLRRAAEDVLGGPPDLWHFHNHSLGKNFVLPQAMRLLAEQGERLLLQFHDFAEDGRPGNFKALLARTGQGQMAELGRQLYPLAPNVHYGLLNGRDRRFLHSAGAPEDQLHLLANPVAFGDAKPAEEAGQGEFVLYPTRAIRRKNLGEFLLLRLLDKDLSRRWAVTMAPENPDARPIYEDWVALADKLGLNLEFEWGTRSGLPFPELISASQFLVTTSVAEGFGLAFLEPWLLGKQIFGRDLPEITSDFLEDGIDLSTLYRSLPVAVDLLDFESFRQRTIDLLRQYYADYDQPAPDDALERFLAVAVDEDAGTIDFGRLDEIAQIEVLRKLHEGAEPPQLESVLPQSRIGESQQVRENRQIIEARYSLEAYCERLMRVYETVAASPAPESDPGALDSQRILEQFLAPERFMPIRT